ncbi:uncharacterized protein [Dermacentor andersoni]|uniref:uncharacterized protein n=1 Tax=Dermacentor andersoni TaxID=34620 RepID=UPI003B3B1928
MDLKSLRKPKLLELARELGLDVSDKLRKPELLRAILELEAEDDELSECLETIEERETAKRQERELKEQKEKDERELKEQKEKDERERKEQKEKEEREHALEMKRLELEMERARNGAVHLQDSEDLCEKHLLAPTLVSCPSGSLPLESLEQDQSLKSMHGSLRSCRLCPYVTGNKALMKRHVRTHTGERPFKCHLCPNTFTQRWSLTRHVRSHMDERDYQCHLCPAAFSDGSNLKRFLAIRVPGAVSVARVRAWQAAFLLAVHLQDSEDLLEERLRAYTVIRSPFYAPCDFAGSLPLESLEQDQSLESMHGSLRSCRLCPYVTGNKGHMKRHLRTHTGERPFKCHLCPNTFVQKCSLTRHVRSHMDERDYQCHLCPAAFSDGSNLKRHVRCHAGERPFRCAHCSASFSQKRNLHVHMYCHRGKKP